MPPTGPPSFRLEVQGDAVILTSDICSPDPCNVLNYKF